MKPQIGQNVTSLLTRAGPRTRSDLCAQIRASGRNWHTLHFRVTGHLSPHLRKIRGIVVTITKAQIR